MSAAGHGVLQGVGRFGVVSMEEQSDVYVLGIRREGDLVGFTGALKRRIAMVNYYVLRGAEGMCVYQDAFNGSGVCVCVLCVCVCVCVLCVCANKPSQRSRVCLRKGLFP